MIRLVSAVAKPCLVLLIGLAATVMGACAMRPFQSIGEPLALSTMEWLFAAGLGLLCSAAAAWRLTRGSSLRQESVAFLEAASADD